jgi:hypothetical protein
MCLRPLIRKLGEHLGVCVEALPAAFTLPKPLKSVFRVCMRQRRRVQHFCRRSRINIGKRAKVRLEEDSCFVPAVLAQ